MECADRRYRADLIRGYRLIGYDNRTMSNEDFNDDSVDAGELGNSEDVTAFYEIILASSDEEVPPTDITNDVNADDEIEYDDLEDGTFMAVHLRFKLPDSETSTLVTHPIDNFYELKSPSLKFVFASTLAQLGLVLRGSIYIDDRDISELDDRILDAFSDPEDEAVAELLNLLEMASLLL